MCGDTLLPSGEAQLLRGGGLDVHLGNSDFKIRRHVLRHERQVRRQPRRLGDEGGVDVFHPQMALLETGADPAQEYAAVDVLVLRIAVGKVPVSAPRRV